MLYHGEADPMIPEFVSTFSYQILKERGLDHYTHTVEPGLEHSLSIKEIKKLHSFFTNLMQ